MPGAPQLIEIGASAVHITQEGPAIAWTNGPSWHSLIRPMFAWGYHGMDHLEDASPEDLAALERAPTRHEARSEFIEWFREVTAGDNSDADHEGGNYLVPIYFASYDPETPLWLESMFFSLSFFVKAEFFTTPQWGTPLLDWIVGKGIPNEHVHKITQEPRTDALFLAEWAADAVVLSKYLPEGDPYA